MKKIRLQALAGIFAMTLTLQASQSSAQTAQPQPSCPIWDGSSELQYLEANDSDFLTFFVNLIKRSLKMLENPCPIKDR